jgi:SNF family Na+-dependent transporter
MQLPYFTRSLLFMTAGPLIWALHFVFIYVVTALICARPSATAQWVSSGLLEWVIGIATAVAIAAILWITLRGIKSNGEKENVRFMQWTAVALGVFSIYAIVLDALPVLFVPACT